MPKVESVKLSQDSTLDVPTFDIYREPNGTYIYFCPGLRLCESGEWVLTVSRITVKLDYMVLKRKKTQKKSTHPAMHNLLLATERNTIDSQGDPTLDRQARLDDVMLIHDNTCNHEFYVCPAASFGLNDLPCPVCHPMFDYRSEQDLIHMTLGLGDDKIAKPFLACGFCHETLGPNCQLDSVVRWSKLEKDPDKSRPTGPSLREGFIQLID